MKPLLLTFLRAYQLGIRPLLGQNCRFFPSCSDYAQQAITAHGALRGSLMAGRRLCKCHPWHPGGFDPVPKLHPESATATPSDPTARPHS